MAVANSIEYRFVVDALDLATASKRFIAASPERTVKMRMASSAPLLTTDARRQSKVTFTLLKNLTTDAGARASASPITCTCSSYPQPPDADLITVVNTSYVQTVESSLKVRGTKSTWKSAKKLATNCFLLFRHCLCFNR